MKPIATIGLIIATGFGSLVLSLLLSWFAWEMLIPERAFHCTDDGLSIAFWQSADTHRSAGDKILPGWTWEKINLVNNLYEFAFFALWFGGSVVSFRASRSILRDYYP